MTSSLFPTEVPAQTSTGADPAIGSRLREVRRARGLTTLRLAEIIGCSRASLYKYEQGRRELSAGHLFALNKHLGIDPSWLVTGTYQSADEVQATIDEHQEIARRAATLADEGGVKIDHSAASVIARTAMLVDRRSRGEGGPKQPITDDVLRDLIRLQE